MAIWNKVKEVNRTAWIEKAKSLAATGIICIKQSQKEKMKTNTNNQNPRVPAKKRRRNRTQAQ